MSRTEPGTPESVGPPADSSDNATGAGSGATFRWPGLSARQVSQDAPPGAGESGEAGDGLGLPPLPNLRPLSIFRPFVPMADSTASGVPLPAPVTDADTLALPEPVVEPTTAPMPIAVQPANPVATPAAPRTPTSVLKRSARSIVVIGPSGPLRDAITRRLAALGAGVVLPTAQPRDFQHPPPDDATGNCRFVVADPSDTDSMIGLITEAAGSNGDLGGVIVLSGGGSGSAGRRATAESSEEFSDVLAGALSTDVLGVAAALHAAVGRLTIAGRAGRIVIVTGRGGSDVEGPAGPSLPADLSEAALGVIATHLARAAGPEVGTILISAAAASGGGTASIDASAGVVDAVLLGVGPALGLPGLRPIAGTVVQLRL